MRVAVGSVPGRAAVAVALAAVLGGCAQPGNDDKKGAGAPASASASEKDAGSGVTQAAASGGAVGAQGSDCPLPVGFSVARHWKAKAVDTGGELSSKASKTPKDSDGAAGALAGSLLRRGSVTMACEIDAKPAGHIGFLRVWTGKHGNADAGAVLRRFVAAEDNTSGATYRSVTTGGGLSGVEVEYLYTSKLLDETKKETALAVSTPDGPVVLHLGGMDTEEHEAMRPAYELAKRTLKLS